MWDVDLQRFFVYRCCSGPFFKKTVADSNAPVQEKALDALIAFLKAADADAGRWVRILVVVVGCILVIPVNETWGFAKMMI